MAIVGTGIDLVATARIRAALDHPHTGARFRTRVFTAGEQAYCEDRGRGRYQSYAARFAAKEAVMKALGCGWGRHAGWLDIEVAGPRDGRPEILLGGHAADYARSLGVRRIHLSLTHAADLALAQVVVER